MEKILVSVIVPIYNVKDYLETCLDSIKGQTLRELEVILVDDGSSDGSEKICDRYAEEDRRFRVIHQPNSGAAAARNHGLQEARGQYIVFQDSDDILEPDAYETLYNLARKENADIAFGLIERMFRKELNEVATGEVIILCEDEILDTYIRDEIRHPYIQKSLCDKLYRKEIIEDLRLPEKIVTGEDGYFNTKALCRAKKVAYISKVIYHYRDKREGNISSTWITNRIFIDRIPAMLEQIEDLKRVDRKDLARYKTLTFYRELQRLYYRTYTSGNPRKKQIMEELRTYFKGRKTEVRESYHYEGASLGYRLKMESFLITPVFYCMYMKLREKRSAKKR